jgi:hypothetical protein
MCDIAVKKANLIEIDNKQFYEGQNVSIRVEGCNWRNYDGRITSITDGYLELDCSRQYNSNFKTIYFKEIVLITHLR